jgi:Tol biopolymer transport system component
LIFAYEWNGVEDTDSLICTTELNEAEPECFGFTDAWHAYPSWSPDGATILFQSNVSGRWEIYTVPAVDPNSTPTQLTDDDASSFSGIAAWSPSGELIAFSSIRNTAYRSRADIFVMAADGSNPINLTDDSLGNRWASWSPDGGRIVFASNRDARSGGIYREELFVMNADGSNLIQITKNDFHSYEPDWYPVASRSASPGRKSVQQTAFDLPGRQLPNHLVKRWKVVDPRALQFNPSTQAQAPPGTVKIGKDGSFLPTP